METSQKIIVLIKECLQNLGISGVDFVVEHPESFSHGDYFTNVAMISAKKLGKNPRDLAVEIKSFLEKNKTDFIEKIEIAGPGFINFFLKDSFFVGEVGRILKNKKTFGFNKNLKGKKVLVEFSSPNIAKPFSIGHLRSTIIGDAVANLLNASGAKVVRDNHLGDWGTQFGKQLVAIEKWGNLNDLEKSKNPVKELVALYVRFHEEAEKDPSLEELAREKFKLLESGRDKKVIALWKRCIDLSNKEFDLIYKRLAVRFDTALGESEFVKEKRLRPVIEALNKNSLLKESEGAKVVFFEGEKYPPLIIEKTDGTTIYATRDLAADYYRKNKYGDDLVVINEVGAEQSLHFNQLFEVEKMLGWFTPGQRVHVAHGLYRFKDGKMSTRKGNVIWLEDILNEAISKASEFNKDSAEIVGIGALKFNDLKRESIQDIVFDWEQVLNLKGDSGPYVQYAGVRTVSIVNKAKEVGVKASFKKIPKSVGSLEKILARFEEVVMRAGREYAPHYLATYLVQLAGEFNSYYAQNTIVDEKDEYSPYKVALTQSVGIVITNGLGLLGIKVPEKM